MLTGSVFVLIVSWLCLCLYATAQPLCQLDPQNRTWMCDDCSKVRECQDVYGIIGEGRCSSRDLYRFNIMYNLLEERIPGDQIVRYTFSGNASCTLGATIAMSLNGVFGDVCASNERPQLNAAQTNIFCMCNDSYCDVEYTDTILNILLSCLVALLTLYLSIGSVRLCLRTEQQAETTGNALGPTTTTATDDIDPNPSTNTTAAQKHWTRMKIRTHGA